MFGEDFYSKVFILLFLLGTEALQRFEFNESFGTSPKGFAGTSAERQQRIDLHGGDNVFIVSQVKGWGERTVDVAKQFWSRRGRQLC